MLHFDGGSGGTLSDNSEEGSVTCEDSLMQVYSGYDSLLMVSAWWFRALMFLMKIRA